MMYDPICDKTLPTSENLPDSFWAHQIPSNYQPYESLASNLATDVAIVGGGFTGLSAALHIRQQYGVQVTLLEANQPGWGASGRNGGFVLPGTGRLSVQQLQNKWGSNKAQAIYADYLDSVHLVKTLIDEGIECEYTQGGYLKLAHTPKLVAPLREQASLLSDKFSDNIVALDQDEIEAGFLKANKSFGGIYQPSAFSVNPWMLCQGIAAKAHDAGALIFGNTSAIHFDYKNNEHQIHTSDGSIRAKHLVLATNAYGLHNFHPTLNKRMFPVMSSILVTSPLSSAQLNAIGMRQGLMVMDTRPLKYYLRLLPDNRLLFGGRGPIKGKNANNKASKKALLEGLLASFPQLSSIDIAYFWSGWVSVSYDDYPRIFHDEKHNCVYAGAYCGAGVAFSIQAGKRLAQLLFEPNTLPDLPYWQSALKPFPFSTLRRPALQVFYTYQALKNAIS